MYMEKEWELEFNQSLFKNRIYKINNNNEITNTIIPFIISSLYGSIIIIFL